MKRTLAILLLSALLLGAIPALAEPAGYSAIYAQDNPIPQIARDVRPAVVQVLADQVLWSKATGTSRTTYAMGSGVYVDERGYILTNNHIIIDADEVQVVLLDGTKIPATVVGRDDGTDVAVIKIDQPIDAKPVPLGDSDALEVGELAIAIGNPGTLGGGVLAGSVTAGIISGIAREDISAGNFTRSVKVIQTDTAINTGNSGGALLNARGELIGIPTLKYVADAASVYEGLGFAVPINTVKPIFTQLIDKGYVTRPRLGVLIATVEGPEEPLRMYPPMGAQVMQVDPGTPADKAGLRRLDIITHLNQKRVGTINQLMGGLDEYKAGDTITLTVCRYFDALTGEPLMQWDIFDVKLKLEVLD